MIQDRGDFERGVCSGDGDRRCATGDEQPRPRAGPVTRERHRHLEWPDANQFVERRAPGRFAREVDQVENGAASLLVEVTVIRPVPSMVSGI
jgi:hypothetical protein